MNRRKKITIIILAGLVLPLLWISFILVVRPQFVRRELERRCVDMVSIEHFSRGNDATWGMLDHHDDWFAIAREDTKNRLGLRFRNDHNLAVGRSITDGLNIANLTNIIPAYITVEIQDSCFIEVTVQEMPDSTQLFIDAINEWLVYPETTADLNNLPLPEGRVEFVIDDLLERPLDVNHWWFRSLRDDEQDRIVDIFRGLGE